MTIDDLLSEETEGSAKHKLAEPDSCFPGFSDRLNHLMDLSPEIPRINQGRRAFLADISRSSKMAPGQWLHKDKPPKPSSLRIIVPAIISYLEESLDVLKVEAWLLYGPEVVADPFAGTTKEEDQTNNTKIIPLAVNAIIKMARRIGVTAESYNLDTLLPAVVEMLVGFGINDEEKIEPIHEQIIEQFILAHKKDPIDI